MQWYPRTLRLLLAEVVGATSYKSAPPSKTSNSKNLKELDIGQVCPDDITGAIAQQEISGAVINPSKTCIADNPYALEFPNKVFGYSDYELNVEPCSLAITFINKDKVRHQWMVHGLPRYLYGQGMFHLEAAGSREIAGIFIVPSDHKTYLIHCDMAQHMQKGMKAQLVVGKGSGNLWAIPGISADFNGGNYLPEKIWFTGLVVFIFSGMLAYKFYK